MAEEGFSPQMMPPKKIDDATISFRRNSTGKKASSNSREKAVPRYLRSSTGSCHDFCKYGHKHAVEEKARRPFARRVAEKPSESSISISVDSVASLGRKKSMPTVAKVKASPDGSNMTRSLDRMSFVRGERHKTPLARVKADASTENLKVSLKKERSSSAKRPTSAKVVSFPNASGGMNGKRDAKIGKKTVTSRVASTKVSQRPSLSGAAGSNRKSKSSEKAVSPPCNHIGEAEPAKPENDEVEEKTLYVIKTETDWVESCTREIEYVVEMENGDDALDWDQSEHCTREVGYVDKIGTEENDTIGLDQSEHCAREVEYVDKIGTEDNGTFGLDQSDHGAREIEYVDKIESEDNASFELHQSKTCDVVSSLSDHPSSASSFPNEDEEEEEEKDHEEFEYTMSEYDDDDTSSENSAAETMEKNSENKMHHKGPVMVHTEDEDEKGWKMKFRRGRVVEIQPEDNAPRRLRFRRGRVVEGREIGSDEGRRRRYRRRGDVEEDGAGNGTEKVVLKHQDVQRGRRDAQGLFNNVIEETASKLVESRKSKVKALVGAFETVISLQDGKPSSNATAS